MSTAIFLEGCNKSSVLCVTVHVVTHCESCTNGMVRIKMKLNEYGVRNHCFRQQRTGYFTKHSVHYVYCIYVLIRTNSFLVQLTAFGVQRDAQSLY